MSEADIARAYSIDHLFLTSKARASRCHSVWTTLGLAYSNEYEVVHDMPTK